MIPTTSRSSWGVLAEAFDTHNTLIREYIGGAEVEIFNPAIGEWQVCHTPQFRPGCKYRVKPPEPPLEIPWDLIDPEWISAAMDLSGRVHLRDTVECIRVTTCWSSINPMKARVVALVLNNLNPRNVPWDKSLTIRPGVDYE